MITCKRNNRFWISLVKISGQIPQFWLAVISVLAVVITIVDSPCLFPACTFVCVWPGQHQEKRQRQFHIFPDKKNKIWMCLTVHAHAFGHNCTLGETLYTHTTHQHHHLLRPKCLKWHVKKDTHTCSTHFPLTCDDVYIRQESIYLVRSISRSLRTYTPRADLLSPPNLTQQ